MSSLPLALGSLIDARYRLLRVLGEGATAVVYLAERGDGGSFAVKVLRECSSKEAIARFIREARLASSLKHPAVLPVVDSGVDGATGRCFLVMPPVEGDTLGSLVARLGPLRPEVAVRLVLQAAEGLVAAHEVGIVHRDIKPENILLRRSGDQVSALIADFGIAHEADAAQALTATGLPLGTPLYMAPEQFYNAKKADARADVWALGATLFEALSGEAPLTSAGSVADVIVRVSTEDLPPLQDTAPWIDPELALVVHTALLRDLAGRCPDVRSFAEALRAHALGAFEVSAAHLQPISDDLRALRAPRAVRATSWQDVVARRAAPPAPADSRLGTSLGSFRLDRKLGEGGMGAVYEALGADGERAAVKVISAAGAEHAETVRRFVREARATSSIRSEHVVRVLSTGHDGATPFIAMELLRGLDLDTQIRRVGPLEPASVARVFVQAARGLAAAHAAGIVHRDVKPANLFLHEDDGGLICTKVCDFGVAKSSLISELQATTMELTKTGGMIGSPLYMSPEQAKNAKHVTTATDIWSLCLSLYEALSGKKPWAGCSTMGELILSICTADIAPIQHLAPWVSPGLATVVHQGLARDPAARWASMDELAAALEPLAAPEPITRRALCSLSDEQRSTAAPLLPAIGAASTIGVTTPSPATAGSTSPRPWTLLLAGALALAGVGAGVAYSQRSAPAAAPAAPLTLKRPVRIQISPPGARITIAGTPHPLDADGTLALSAEPGESFDVLAEADGSSTHVKLFISRDGTPDPSAIRVPPPAPLPTVSAVASVAPSTAASATPAASAAPAAAAASAKARPPAVKPTTTAADPPKTSTPPAVPNPMKEDL